MSATHPGEINVPMELRRLAVEQPLAPKGPSSSLGEKRRSGEGHGAPDRPPPIIVTPPLLNAHPRAIAHPRLITHARIKAPDPQTEVKISAHCMSTKGKGTSIGLTARSSATPGGREGWSSYSAGWVLIWGGVPP